jgi:hypothetical protein
MIVICSHSGYFADDVKAECDQCGAGVVHRPHIPADATLICMDCARAHLVAERAAGRLVDVGTTEETRRELLTYYGKAGSA